MSEVRYSYEKGTQSLRGEAIDMGHRPQLRARVKRDAHDFQSHAVVEGWTPEGWKEITHRPILETGVSAFSYVSRDTEAWQAAMRRDLDELLCFAREFYGGPAA